MRNSSSLALQQRDALFFPVTPLAQAGRQSALTTRAHCTIIATMRICMKPLNPWNKGVKNDHTYAVTRSVWHAGALVQSMVQSMPVSERIIAIRKM